MTSQRPSSAPDTFASLGVSAENFRVDSKQRDPIDGEFFLLDDTAHAWLIHLGVPQLGPRIGNRPVAMLYCLSEPFTWRGPLPLRALNIIGRVLALAPDTEQNDPLSRLERERRVLTEQLSAVDEQWCNLEFSLSIQERRGLAPDEDTAGELAAVEAWFARIDRLAESCGLPRGLLHRQAALNARLDRLERSIAQTPADDIAGALIKLDLLRRQHEDDDPDADPCDPALVNLYSVIDTLQRLNEARA